MQPAVEAVRRGSRERQDGQQQQSGRHCIPNEFAERHEMRGKLLDECAQGVIEGRRRRMMLLLLLPVAVVVIR